LVKASKIRLGVAVGVGGVLLLAYAYYLNQSENVELDSLTRKGLLTAKVPWTYEDILTHFREYDGEIIHFFGDIITVDDVGENRYEAQVALEDTLDSIIVDYSGKKLSAGDNVEVFGEVTDIREMKLVDGGSTPVPVIIAIRLNCLSC